MNVLFFNEAKQGDLLGKADAARQKRHYREAYGFVREALRFGENAAVLNRATAILNEMGEYATALQLARHALKCESRNACARWEMARACERLWLLDDALDLLRDLNEARVPDAPAGFAAARNDLIGMCRLKRGDLDGVRRALFRGAGRSGFPEPLASRVRGLEEVTAEAKRRAEASATGSAPGMGLREWLYVMRGSWLIVRRTRERRFATDVVPGLQAPDSFEGEHFVVGCPDFLDCGRILDGLVKVFREKKVSLAGIYPCDFQSLPVALAAARLLDLPLAEASRLAAPRPLLLCLAGNADSTGARAAQRLPSRHPLFLMVKNFEREEFHDAAPPPHNQPRLNSWAEPMLSDHHQMIGAIGECLLPPWEDAAAPALKTSPAVAGIGMNRLEKRPHRPVILRDARGAREIADRLVAAAEAASRLRGAARQP